MNNLLFLVIIFCILFTGHILICPINVITITCPRPENQGNPFTINSYDVTSTYEETTKNHLFIYGIIPPIGTK